jgi:prepilin-type N-terminal cleavage/methylation domain-containing protein
MRFARRPSYTEPRRRSGGRRGFTLVEVLASLLLMAIIIPVAMEGMSVASRAGVLGQRKAAAMRVAERVLNELVAEGQTQQSTDSGTAVDGDTAYSWTMRVENWSEDAMQQMTVAVTFQVQGNSYEVSATTLLPATGAYSDEMGATQ